MRFVAAAFAVASTIVFIDDEDDDVTAAAAVGSKTYGAKGFLVSKCEKCLFNAKTIGTEFVPQTNKTNNNRYRDDPVSAVYESSFELATIVANKIKSLHHVLSVDLYQCWRNRLFRIAAS